MIETDSWSIRFCQNKRGILLNSNAPSLGIYSSDQSASMRISDDSVDMHRLVPHAMLDGPANLRQDFLLGGGDYSPNVRERHDVAAAP